MTSKSLQNTWKVRIFRNESNGVTVNDVKVINGAITAQTMPISPFRPHRNQQVVIAGCNTCDFALIAQLLALIFTGCEEATLTI